MTTQTGKSTFTYHSTYPCSAKELYLWHSREGALQRLLPTWQKIKIIKQSGGTGGESGGISEGAEVALQIAEPLPFLSFLPIALPLTFAARHTKAEPYSFFQDRQERGVFQFWQHNHYITETKDGCELKDEISYTLPLHNLLPRFIHRQVAQKLEAMFAFRANRLAADITLHKRLNLDQKQILISGAGGSVGSELLPLLTTAGHRVWRLVRRQVQGEQEIFWNPATGEIDLSSLPPLDAVIHLGGESIGMARWSKAKKKRILESRTESTKTLVKAICALPVPPKVFLCASASGYYGEFCGFDTDGRLPGEESAAGTNFIAAVCKAWEKEADMAAQAGIRTVKLRFAVGLTPQWGALQQMLATSFAGVVRSLGGGSQQMGWVAVEDMAAAILHCMATSDIAGAVNIAAPAPASNAEFHRVIAKVIKKPMLPSLPASLIKLIYGEIADEMLLADCAISPQKLIDSGFSFRHSELEGALRAMLGRIEKGEEA